MSSRRIDRIENTCLNCSRMCLLFWSPLCDGTSHKYLLTEEPSCETRIRRVHYTTSVGGLSKTWMDILKWLIFGGICNFFLYMLRCLERGWGNCILSGWCLRNVFICTEEIDLFRSKNNKIYVNSHSIPYVSISFDSFPKMTRKIYTYQDNSSWVDKGRK